ncbi:Flagellar hook-length control protein FliK [Lactococcus cremoris]|uniref:Flagellar hook-length control protein FliK n=1 Tax=Lactococcus lactis subsp. cremoris TaxID=1359 RepID=A0A166JTY8_LACLC|nr:hypothetical protein [Lactococcus cremoris]KZK06642.1 Flagellar hook-length control protein FliK [Lactococcus cremoris]
MKLNSLNKKFALASVSLLTFSALAGFGGLVNVNAKTSATTDQVSNGEVAIYAEQAAPTGSNVDGTNNDGSDQSGLNTNNVAGDGSGQTNVGGTANNPGATGTVYGMQNVTFDVYSITSTTGKTSDMDPSKLGYNDDGSISGLSDADITLGSKATSGTTDATGLADITGLSDGYYLIYQVTTVGGIRTVQPFIIQVNTADASAGVLNVYPKMNLGSSNTAADSVLVKGDPTDTVTDPNTVSNSKLSTTGATGTTSDDVTYANQDVNSNVNTAGSNDTVTWNINSVFDQSQVTNSDNAGNNVTGSYSITDTQDSGNPAGLSTLTVSKVNVTNSDGKILGALSSGTDYTVSGGTVTLTTAGQLKAAGLIAADAGSTKTYGTTGGINVQYTSTVSDAAIGVFKDAPSTNIVNAYGTNLSDSSVNTGIKASVLNVGGIDFQKVDAHSTSTLLKGAQFVLVQAKTAADAQNLVETNTRLFNNETQTDGSAFVAVTSDNAKFVTDSTGKALLATTNASGVAEFTALNLVDTNTDASNTANNNGTYYAVEVHAPNKADGNDNNYALPTVSTAANVFPVNATTTSFNGSGTTDSNTISNTQPFALPFTGGQGLAGIIAIATVSGVVAFAIKRRKDNEEEVVK